MNYYFLRKSPESVEGMDLYPLMPKDKAKVLEYFDLEDDDYLDDNYPQYYTRAIHCEDQDVSEFYDSCFVPLQNEDGDNFLMLGGCGMDFSWEIASAFISHGYMPPLYVCRLPGMAGRGESPKDKKIIAACNESLQAEIDTLTLALKINKEI